VVLGWIRVGPGIDGLGREESRGTGRLMNPVAPASGDAQLLAQLSTTDYNPNNYLAGAAPTMPIPQIIILGLVIWGAWMIYGKGH
jgi:hypothetical protein